MLSASSQSFTRSKDKTTNSNENLVLNVNSVSVILDPNDQRTKQTIYFANDGFLSVTDAENFSSIKNKEFLENSLKRKCTKINSNLVIKDFSNMLKIHEESTPEDVKRFLISRDFTHKWAQKNTKTLNK